MQTVCHRGIAVGLDHPAVWIDRGEQIVRDRSTFLPMPISRPIACGI
jgi:hypothetical protein